MTNNIARTITEINYWKSENENQKGFRNHFYG